MDAAFTLILNAQWKIAQISTEYNAGKTINHPPNHHKWVVETSKIG